MKTIDQIKDRCRVDEFTGCWLWAGAIRSTLWCMSTHLRLIWRRSCRNDKNPHQPVGQWGAISGQDVARMAPRAATITSP